MQGEMPDWTVGSGRGMVQPFVLGTQSCFMGVSRVGVHSTGTSPRGRHGAGSEETAPHSTFAPADADYGGAGGTLTLAGRTPGGGLFQLGDDLRQGLTVPFALPGRSQEVNRLERNGAPPPQPLSPATSRLPALTLTLSQAKLPPPLPRQLLGGPCPEVILVPPPPHPPSLQSSPKPSNQRPWGAG